jgi:hypothetical protein
MSTVATVQGGLLGAPKQQRVAAGPVALLDLDLASVRRRFPHQPFTIRHHLVGHPLFALDRLVELARSLPPANVEYNAGDLPLTVDPAVTPQNGLSIEETIRRIEDCGSWMVLKFVESDPAYRELLDRCVDEVLDLCDPPLPGVSQRYAFIFISSPNAVTPFHIDPEHNFLLQIRGSKKMAVFPVAQPVISERDLERFYSGAHRNLVFDERYQERATVFSLTPGVGLHVPVTAPHWVRNGDQVSVSFSITFRSELSESREAVYKLNHRLRRMHVAPTPYGARPRVDAAKAFAFRSALAMKRKITGAARPVHDH